MKSILNNTRLLAVASIVIIAAAALRLYAYWIGATYIPVTTDEALTVLQALDIRDGHLPLLLAAQPYMFPVEAYLMAPLVELLPRTAFGMRTLVMLEGAVFVVMSLLVLRRIGSFHKTWSAALLILFPSAYLLINQTAYSLPHNNSAFILALIAAWIILGLNREPGRRDFFIAVAGGFFLVLAFSNAMLSLSLVAPLAVVTAWHSVGRGRWIRLAGYATGGLIAIVPYAAAIVLMPGAHSSVTASHAIGDAMQRLWSPTLSVTLPVTFGWRPTPFPDEKGLLDWGTWGYDLFPYVFSALFLGAAVLCLIALISAAKKRERTYLGGTEWALGAILLSCFFFMLSKRADSTSYRYLLPILVVFPFLLAGLLTRLPRVAHALLAAGVVVVTGYNAITVVKVSERWKTPGFAHETVAAPDLAPAITFLRENGIRHAVASHWAAYRIGFEAAGDVVCSQPFNERFHGWPVPYKDEVDASTNVAYVLTERIRFLKPRIFERHMRTMGVTSRVHTAGHFRIYYDFDSPLYRESRQLDSNAITIHATENTAALTDLFDGRQETFWRSENLQSEGIALTFMLEDFARLSHIVLQYGRFAHDRAGALKIEENVGGLWVTTHEHLKLDEDKFRWYRGKPTYGVAQETIELSGENVLGVRISIADPKPDWCWTVTEAQVFARDK